MIRYYEQIGLIPASERTESGYRKYALNDVHRLVFIRSARDLGFSLEDIEGLLTLWNDKSRQSIDVKRLAQENIADLERRMESIRHAGACSTARNRRARHCSVRRVSGSPLQRRPRCGVLLPVRL